MRLARRHRLGYADARRLFSFRAKAVELVVLVLPLRVITVILHRGLLNLLMIFVNIIDKAIVVIFAYLIEMVPSSPCLFVYFLCVLINDKWMYDLC